MKPVALLMLLGIALSTSACGKKGDPRAPELATPKVIQNLSVRTGPTGVTLMWSRPTEYVDGKELKDLINKDDEPPSNDAASSEPESAAS